MIDLEAYAWSQFCKTGNIRDYLMYKDVTSLYSDAPLAYHEEREIADAGEYQWDHLEGIRTSGERQDLDNLNF